MAQRSYLINPGTSAEMLAQQREQALASLRGAADTSPKSHWLQALSQTLQGGLAGYELGEMGGVEKGRQDEASDLYRKAFELYTGGGAGGGAAGSGGAGGAAGAAAGAAAVAPGPASPAMAAAAAAGREAAMPVPDADLTSLIKQEEGFVPVAKWDVRQHSGGYGSKAAPGETFDQAKAEQYLQRDAAEPIRWVRQNARNATPEQQKALVSFGYNLGVDDLEKLKPDIQAGNWERVGERMLSFDNALNERTGRLEPLPGLQARRAREAALVRGQGGAPGAPAATAQPGGAPGNPRAQMAGDLYRNEITRPLATQMLSTEMGRQAKKPEVVSIEMGNGRKRSMLQMPDGSLKPIPAEMMGGQPGGPTPPDLEDSQKLRKEFMGLTNVKKYDDAIGSFNSMLKSAASDTPASDLDMIYGLAKIMDPESVVREGEFATVRSSQAIPDQIRGYWQFLVEGKGKLDPNARAKIVEVARGRLGAYREQAQTDETRFRDLSTRYGIDPSFVVKPFPELGTFTPPPQQPQAPRGPVIKWEDGPDGKPRRVQ